MITLDNGYKNLRALLAGIQHNKEVIEFYIGGEPTSIDLFEAKFLYGIYKAYRNSGRQEEFIRDIGNANGLDKFMRKLHDMLDSQRNFRGSGPNDDLLENTSSYAKLQIRDRNRAKAEFKYNELAQEEGDHQEVRNAIERAKYKYHYLKIDGKILKDSFGGPKVFNTHKAASAYALAMAKNNPKYKELLDAKLILVTTSSKDNAGNTNTPQTTNVNRGPWYIKINGKTLRTHGEPKVFNNVKGASAYAETMARNSSFYADAMRNKKIKISRSPEDTN